MPLSDLALSVSLLCVSHAAPVTAHAGPKDDHEYWLLGFSGQLAARAARQACAVRAQPSDGMRGRPVVQNHTLVHGYRNIVTYTGLVITPVCMHPGLHVATSIPTYCHALHIATPYMTVGGV